MAPTTVNGQQVNGASSSSSEHNRPTLSRLYALPGSSWLFTGSQMSGMSMASAGVFAYGQIENRR